MEVYGAFSLHTILEKRDGRDKVKRVRLESRFVKGLVIFFLAGFIGGILSVNLLGDGYLSQAGILSDFFLKQYKYLEIDGIGLFFYILEKRIKWVALLWILGYTVAGVPCAAAYTAWMGFSAGTLFSIGVLKLGMLGILFCAGAMVPQIFIFVPAWIFFLYGIYRKSVRRNQGGRNPSGGIDWNYILIGVGMCLFLLFGILVESYINPWIVKRILRLF